MRSEAEILEAAKEFCESRPTVVNGVGSPQLCTVYGMADFALSIAESQATEQATEIARLTGEVERLNRMFADVRMIELNVSRSAFNLICIYRSGRHENKWTDGKGSRGNGAVYDSAVDAYEGLTAGNEALSNAGGEGEG